MNGSSFLMNGHLFVWPMPASYRVITLCMCSVRVFPLTVVSAYADTLCMVDRHHSLGGSMARIVFCNGVYVAWAPWKLSASEAWQAVRYSTPRIEGVRVFACVNEEQAETLCAILAR